MPYYRKRKTYYRRKRNYVPQRNYQTLQRIHRNAKAAVQVRRSRMRRAISRLRANATKAIGRSQGPFRRNKAYQAGGGKYYKKATRIKANTMRKRNQVNRLRRNISALQKRMKAIVTVRKFSRATTSRRKFVNRPTRWKNPGSMYKLTNLQKRRMPHRPEQYSRGGFVKGGYQRGDTYERSLWKDFKNKGKYYKEYE